jgi:hypothetical protein
VKASDKQARDTLYAEHKNIYIASVGGQSLSVSNENRESFGKDAIAWLSLVKKESEKSSVDANVLSQMSLLLRVGCAQVHDYSMDEKKRDKLKKTYSYFQQSERVFTSVRDSKDNGNLKKEAEKFYAECEAHVAVIVECSKYKNTKRS